jgi:hypothetical protein
MSKIKTKINSELNYMTADDAVLENVLASQKHEQRPQLRLRKRFIIAAACAVLLLLVGFGIYDVLVNDYFRTLPYRVPFEDITIYSAELVDGRIRVSQSYAYTTMTQHAIYDTESRTVELHFTFHGEEEEGGVRGDIIFQTYIYTAPVGAEVKTHDDFLEVYGRYEVVAIYYCEGHALTGDMGGQYIGEVEKYLVWER